MILPPAAAIGAWTAWILGVVAALSVMLYVLVGRLEARRRRADFRARLREHKANQRRMMDAHAGCARRPGCPGDRGVPHRPGPPARDAAAAQAAGAGAAGPGPAADDPDGASRAAPVHAAPAGVQV